MGRGGGGGLTDWHRQKRKRELQKNKEQRLAARDAKVRESKTVATVKEEIRSLERQFKTKEARPHQVQSKLDRLNKELKIVQQEEEAKKQASSSQSDQQQRAAAAAAKKAPVWKPLENPAISIYYDAVMNPFGVPPPGKPHLYHTPTGGTTMHLQEAGLPGQFPPPPPPPPTPTHDNNPKRDYQTHNQPVHAQGRSQSNRDKPRNDHYGPSTTKPDERKPSESRPPPPPPPDRGPINSSKPNNGAGLVNPGLTSIRPKRYGKQKNDDIWASKEDVKTYGDGYGEESPATPTQIKKKKKGKQKTSSSNSSSNTSSDQWHYQDQAGQVQGPFTTDQMQQWIAGGFFPPDQYIQSASTGTWTQLQNTPGLKEFIKRNSNDSESVAGGPESQGSSVQDRIAALKGNASNTSETADEQTGEEEVVQSSSVQDRITALRDARVQENREEDDDTSRPLSVEERIAALRQAHLKENEPATDETEGNSVQDRIEALRRSTIQQEEEEEETRSDVVVAQDLGERKYDEMESSSRPKDSVEARIAALRANHATDATESTLYEEIDEADMSSVPYPVADEGPPAPHPSDGGMADVPYPVADDSMADVAYPVYDDDDDGYPQAAPGPEDDLGDVPYPVQDEYGGAEYDGENPDDGNAVGSYPVVDSYPVYDAYPIEEDEANGGEITQHQEKPAKKAKIDRDVVSMLPSHLKKRQKG